MENVINNGDVKVVDIVELSFVPATNTKPRRIRLRLVNKNKRRIVSVPMDLCRIEDYNIPGTKPIGISSVWNNGVMHVYDGKDWPRLVDFFKL